MINFLAIFCFFSTAAEFIEFHRDYNVSWTHNKEEIQFTVTVNHNGNIGFGLTNQEDLDQAEQVIMGVTGQNTGFLQNADGSRSMYKLISATRVNSQIQRLTFTRPLRPLNCDFELTSSTIRLLWSRYEGPISQTNLQGSGTLDSGIRTTHLVDHEPNFDAPSCDDDNTYCQDFTVDAVLKPQRTQYFCKFVNLSDTDVQVIGFNTIRQDSDPYFHHALLYSCHSPPPQALDPSLRDGFECGDYTMSFLMHCFHAVAIAAVGSTGFEYPPEAGFPVGPGYERLALLEVHYDNWQGHQDIQMTSGLRLKFTTEPRQYEAGHISLGATWMFYLPPAQESFKLYGSCNKECLQAAAGNENDYNMTIFAASSHGHMYMQKQKLSKITDGQEVQTVLNEPHYDRLYQEYKYLEEPVNIGPNDDLMVTCDYRTGNSWVRGGLEQTNEMCYVFALYYPRLKDISFCTSMTMFEEVYDHFEIENAASHYMRIGHPDEMRVTVDGQELNGEDYLNQFHPPSVVAGNPLYESQYEEMLKNSQKSPMCTASRGNVFSLAKLEDGDLLTTDEPDPTPEPEREWQPRQQNIEWEPTFQNEPRSEPEPESSTTDKPGGTTTSMGNGGDPFLGSHMTDVMLDPIIWTPLEEEVCIRKSIRIH